MEAEPTAPAIPPLIVVRAIDPVDGNAAVSGCDDAAEDGFPVAFEEFLPGVNAAISGVDASRIGEEEEADVTAPVLPGCSEYRVVLTEFHNVVKFKYCVVNLDHCTPTNISPKANPPRFVAEVVIRAPGVSSPEVLGLDALINNKAADLLFLPRKAKDCGWVCLNKTASANQRTAYSLPATEGRIALVNKLRLLIVCRL